MSWYPHARRNPAARDGGTYINVPFRGVVHTTESDRFTPNPHNYYGHQNYPHFTVERNGTVWQHIPVSRAARALANRPGGVETNRARAVQIEVVGHAKDTDWPAKQIDAVRQLVAWINITCRITTRTLPPGPIPNSARINAPQRMSFAEWNGFNGWCGHRHVPENHHWDPGAFDLNRIMPGSSSTPTQPEEEDVVQRPEKGGHVQWWQQRINEWHDWLASQKVTGGGHTPLREDGDYGSATETRVANLQAAVGYPSTGKLDSATQSRIIFDLTRRAA